MKPPGEVEKKVNAKVLVMGEVLKWMATCIGGQGRGTMVPFEL